MVDVKQKKHYKNREYIILNYLIFFYIICAPIIELQWELLY